MIQLIECNVHSSRAFYSGYIQVDLPDSYRIKKIQNNLFSYFSDNNNIAFA